jgi:c-di-GMP-binding flagellar brake protein YcgR
MEVEEKAESLPERKPERRANPRHVVDEDAMLLFLNHSFSVPCRIVELSLGGCRLQIGERFLAGILVRVEVTFKVNGIAFRFSGVTEWTEDEHLTGIRFVNMTSRRREELAEVLCEVEADNVAKAAKQAAESLAAEKRAAEERVQEKTSTEQAESQVRQQTEVPAIAEPPKPALQLVESQPAGLPPAPPIKRERRAQSRHEVDTSATILLIKIGSQVRGRILDLSLGGCRIRTDEAFPVGIYTRVEVEFRLEGLPFRLGGVIQAVHDRDRRNAGIRFLDMSDRKRSQVEQLIDEIEEVRAKRQLEELGDPGESTLMTKA